ncbi:hypothetical protein Tco_0933646 [Tanacetum coccineum]
MSVIACNDSFNVKPSNVNFVCVTCGKCVLNENHDLCVLHYKNGINSRTKKLIAVPISTREPKRKENQSVATPHKKTVTSEPTIKKPRSTFRKLYEHLVEIILFIVDSGCSKHMTENLKLLVNFVEKFLGTVKFGNDQFAPILGYCMRTRSQSRNQNHPQQQAPPVVVEPFNLEEPIDNPPVVNMSANGAGGPGSPPAGEIGLPVPDLRTMEELCQPSLDGQGGPISLIAIQATTFGLKNDMIQQVQNPCPFRRSGDDANKHLDKFLHVTPIRMIVYI